MIGTSRRTGARVPPWDTHACGPVPPIGNIELLGTAPSGPLTAMPMPVSTSRPRSRTRPQWPSARASASSRTCRS